jgi:hypothetical protein
MMHGEELEISGDDIVTIAPPARPVAAPLTDGDEEPAAGLQRAASQTMLARSASAMLARSTSTNALVQDMRPTGATCSKGERPL